MLTVRGTLVIMSLGSLLSLCHLIYLFLVPVPQLCYIHNASYLCSAYFCDFLYDPFFFSPPSPSNPASTIKDPVLGFDALSSCPSLFVPPLVTLSHFFPDLGPPSDGSSLRKMLEQQPDMVSYFFRK